jgi:hypothetical protein
MWSGRWPQLALVNAREERLDEDGAARAYALSRRRTRSFLALYREKIFFADMQHALHHVKKARAIELFFLFLSHIVLRATASFYVI